MEISWIGMGVGCFALLSFFARLAAVWLRKSWGWDDTTICITVVSCSIIHPENSMAKGIQLLATPPTIFSVVRMFPPGVCGKYYLFRDTVAENGLGKDIWTVPFDNITRILHVCIWL